MVTVVSSGWIELFTDRPKAHAYARYLGPWLIPSFWLQHARWELSYPQQGASEGPGMDLQAGVLRRFHPPTGDQHDAEPAPILAASRRSPHNSDRL